MGPNNSPYGYYGEQKKKFPVKHAALIAGGIIVLFIVIFTVSTLLSRDSIGTQAQHLSARLSNLSTLTASASTQLINGDLKKVNAETALMTDGTEADLVSVLPKKVDKSIQADEADTSDTTKLSNAALAGTYDSEYKQVLQEQLQSVNALLTEMSSKSKSSATRAALNADYKNYATLLTNLSKVTL